ncbi:Anthocyanin 5-aromatic acyltransferase [Thalictrum thalictroides]|uniref:Anthocyanin 5-aromatic acyltransferase n=1 Tax=Thalictrum thalictroides TaxID=46969 RepID=A0A7J6W9N5_THATH|nr:Anthocyanin 5-aromatic acyltransferase [Thalictrum thalictroides]
MFSVDCRERLNQPLPLTYSGNCIGGVFVKSDRNELTGENGIGIAAEVIGKGIVNADTEVWTIMEKGFRSYGSIPPGQLVTIGGSPNFGIYETDFGWGKPKKNELSLTDSGGAIYFNNHPSEQGAVEILLVRDAIQMEAFASTFTKTLSLDLCNSKPEAILSGANLPSKL